MKKNKTTKTTKIIGTETYINKETGELQDMQVIDIKEDKDANFHKLWLGHIIQSLDLIGNQKIKVLNYLLENMDRQNQVISTQRKIAKDTNISIKTISRTIKALKESNVITQVQSGVYRLNPNIVFKGYNKSRLNVLYKYNTEKNEKKQQKKEQQDKESKGE